MKLLVLGATGAIGRALIPLAIASGHSITVATRHAAKSAWLAGQGARPVVVDALDRDHLFAVLRAERPDAVIHQLTDLAARDWDANNQLRITGTRNLVDAARAVGVRRVVAQSLAFVYAPGTAPAREDEPLDLAAPGARRRTVAGVVALEAAVGEPPEGVALRYGVLYGPGTWYARDGLIADQVRRGELAAGEGVTSFIHVEDAARAALDALGWPPGPVNIVDDEPAPMTLWLPVYAAALGAPPPPSSGQPARNERGASNAKARGELGWQPRYPSWRIGFPAALA